MAKGGGSVLFPAQRNNLMVELDGSKLQKEVSREKVLEIHWSRYLIPRVACVHLQTLRNGMLIDRGNLGEAGIDLFHTDFLQFLILPPHSIFICLSIYLPICARLPAKSFQHTGLPSKRGTGLGSFSRADRGIGGVRPVAPPTWLVSNFLVRPASS